MGKIWDYEKFKATARLAAAEGIVLLKNSSGVNRLKTSLFLTGFNSISFYSLILWVLYFVLKLKYFAPTL